MPWRRSCIYKTATYDEVRDNAGVPCSVPREVIVVHPSWRQDPWPRWSPMAKAQPGARTTVGRRRSPQATWEAERFCFSAGIKCPRAIPRRGRQPPRSRLGKLPISSPISRGSDTGSPRGGALRRAPRPSAACACPTCRTREEARLQKADGVETGSANRAQGPRAISSIVSNAEVVNA